MSLCFYKYQILKSQFTSSLNTEMEKQPPDFSTSSDICWDREKKIDKTFIGHAYITDEVIS